MQTNIKNMLLVVMIMNCVVLKSYLGKMLLQFYQQHIEESKYCTDLMKKHFKKKTCNDQGR